MHGLGSIFPGGRASELQRSLAVHARALLAVGTMASTLMVMAESAASHNADHHQYGTAAEVQPDPAQGKITLAGQIELARLVDLAAKRLKLNIQYDAAILKGTVTLRLEGGKGAGNSGNGAPPSLTPSPSPGVTDTELWALTNRALAASGFTTVRVDAASSSGSPSYQVVKMQDAAAVATLELGKAEGVPGAGTGRSRDGTPAGFQLAVLRVRHRPTKEIVDALKLIISKAGGSVSEIGGGGGGGGGSAVGGGGPGGLILIADLDAKITQAEELVAIMDQPPLPPISDDGRIVTQEIPLRHLSSVVLAALVQQVASKRELVSGDKIPGELIASSTGNSVLLVAPRERADYWKALVAQLDQREPVETRTYTPRHFGIAEVARLVEQSVRDASSGGNGGGGGDERWRLVNDDLTGTFMVTATPSQHERIAALMDRLDSTPPSSRRPVRSFKVRNRGVSELLGVLNNLVVSGALDDAAVNGDTESSGNSQPSSNTAPSVTRTVAPPDKAVTPAPSAIARDSGQWSPPTSPLKKDGASRIARGGGGESRASRSAPDLVTLTADEATSTIIAIGEPRVLSQLETLIHSLDVRQPQVMLEVLLVSLSDTQSLSLGVELEKIEVRGDTIIRLSSLFGLSSSDSGGAGGGNRTAPDRSGFTGLVLNPGEFAIVVRAMESLNNGRSLSIPKVLVGNNQQAVFNSILQQPFAVTTIAGNTGEVSSQSFGGTQDAGTKVSIKSQIAEGDHLVLAYQIELSSFVGSSSSGLPPPKQQNSIQSTVSIPDGFTVAVGGLELTSSSKATTQVPLLGGIPILGELFKNRVNDNNRSRFFVFIRANVLRQQSFEDLKYLSGTAAGAAKIDDGFPVVYPQVIR